MRQQKSSNGKSTTVTLLNGITVERTGFPLREGYALTVNSAQGMTMQETIVDFGNMNYGKVYAHAYVALSRVTTLAGLKVINLPETPAAFNKLYGTHRSTELKRELLRLHDLDEEGGAGVQ